MARPTSLRLPAFLILAILIILIFPTRVYPVEATVLGRIIYVGNHFVIVQTSDKEQFTIYHFKGITYKKNELVNLVFYLRYSRELRAFGIMSIEIGNSLGVTREYPLPKK